MFTKRSKLHPNVKVYRYSKDGQKLGLIKVQAVDQEFQKNAFGFPLNDIAALNGAKSVQEYNMIIARLQEYQANNPDVSNLSVKDMIANIMPRTFQTPSEIEFASNYVGQHWQEKYDAKLEAVERANAEKAKTQTLPPEPQFSTT